MFNGFGHSLSEWSDRIVKLRDGLVAAKRCVSIVAVDSGRRKRRMLIRYIEPE